ncbi:hypothetical protein [Desmospora activa]|uniref:hypothetical protein n=1 Tax=Desmospora activa TaxID=500615 RepID=UPI000D31A6CB|nr:hypothetical protein [Desmospora activa]
MDKVLKKEIVEALETEPPDYKEFVCRYGSGEIGNVVVLGLREAEFVPTPSFFDQTIKYRKELPIEYSNTIVIGVDGVGNPVGFIPPDTSIFVFDQNFGGRCGKI